MTQFGTATVAAALMIGLLTGVVVAAVHTQTQAQEQATPDTTQAGSEAAELGKCSVLSSYDWVAVGAAPANGNAEVFAGP